MAGSKLRPGTRHSSKRDPTALTASAQGIWDFMKSATVQFLGVSCVNTLSIATTVAGAIAVTSAVAITVIRNGSGVAVVSTCTVAIVLNPCSAIAVGAIDTLIWIAVHALDVSAVACAVTVAVVTVAINVSLIPGLTTHVIQVVRLLSWLGVVVDPVHSDTTIPCCAGLDVDIAIRNLSGG